MDYFNALTGPELLEITEAYSPQHRERLYTPTVTPSMFMGQAMNADGSCQQAVNSWAVRRAAEGLSECSSRTGAYCKARQRLTVRMVQELSRKSGRMLSERAARSGLWQGRTVKLVDGTGITMPDNEDNQRVFSQLSTRAAGVGFPIAVRWRYLLGHRCCDQCGHRTVLRQGEQRIGHAAPVAGAFVRGDIMLGDVFYCNYFLIAIQIAAGVDVLFAQNGARITDFRRGQPLGVRDHVLSWPKPVTGPQWMSEQPVPGIPGTDHGARGQGRKSSAGNHPYNVVRLPKAQAALNANVLPRDISFKHTLQLWIQLTSA